MHRTKFERAHAGPVLWESKGNLRAAGRFALAHYINLLSRYKNALSTFGSKIRPTYSLIFTFYAEQCCEC